MRFTQSFLLSAALAGATLGLALPAVAQSAPLPAEICQRGTITGPLPLAHALELEALDYYATHGDRVDYEAFALDDNADSKDIYDATTLAQAIEWPGVLADRAAELPASAHDLPWLALLSYAQTPSADPVWTLTISVESILSPDLPPLLEKHGLMVEAGLLAQAIALFPEWGLNPADRSNLLVDFKSGQVDEALQAKLEAIGAQWPLTPNGPAEAALRLVRAEPALLEAFQARLAALSQEDRLDYLLTRLWAECPVDWSTTETASTSLSGYGSAQAGLMMLDMLTYSLDGPSLYAWFEDFGSSQTDVIVRLLDRQGETELASALKQGMALFPQPFPQDSNMRWTALQAMDPATVGLMDGLMPNDATARVRRVMMALAADSGLLPR